MYTDIVVSKNQNLLKYNTENQRQFNPNPGDYVYSYLIYSDSCKA